MISCLEMWVSRTSAILRGGVNRGVSFDRAFVRCLVAEGV
ncbi:hypothetical protein OH687_27395 [Burkholderia anthina]|nr:hypothetical protein OH687_27395 [Burkholderia anthina]